MKRVLLIAIGICSLFLVSFFIFNNGNNDGLSEVKNESNKESNGTGGKTVEIEQNTPSNGKDDTDKVENKDDVIEMHIDKTVPPKTEEQKQEIMKDEKGQCAIKGYTGENGVKVAILPDNDFYELVESDELFCSINDAEEKGYIDYGRQLHGDEEAREQGVIKN